MITSNRCLFDFAENKKSPGRFENQSKTTGADMKKADSLKRRNRLRDNLLISKKIYFMIGLS